MESLRQYCTTLSLSGTIDEQSLKKAYRREIFKWHPDRHLGDEAKVRAHEQASRINVAYEAISEMLEMHGVVTIAPFTEPTRREQAYQPRHSYQRTSFRPGFPDQSVVEVFVKSSNIISVGYDSASRVLYVKFHSSGVYSYAGVPQQVFDDLLGADSHGTYFHRHVRSKYGYTRHRWS